MAVILQTVADQTLFKLRSFVFTHFLKISTAGIFQGKIAPYLFFTDTFVRKALAVVL